jgi:hypothetical protein
MKPLFSAEAPVEKKPLINPNAATAKTRFLKCNMRAAPESPLSWTMQKRGDWFRASPHDSQQRAKILAAISRRALSPFSNQGFAGFQE